MKVMGRGREEGSLRHVESYAVAESAILLAMRYES
jgi:hypothetical protein